MTDFYTHWALSQQRQQEAARRAETHRIKSARMRQPNIRETMKDLVSKLNSWGNIRPDNSVLDTDLCCSCCPCCLTASS